VEASKETPDLLNFEKSMLIEGGAGQQAGLSELLASGQPQAAAYLSV
jgi:hypothetical protein